jgi:flagellar export protein FliJ
MPPFRFRLQTLERLREAARDACREQLADALRVDDALRSQQMRLDDDLRTARRLQFTPAGRIDVDRLLEAQRFETAVAGEVRRIVEQRTQVAEEIERRRDALVEANREVKVLEKLKAARKAEHDRDAERADTKRLDEAAGRRRLEEADV